jgi:hypothetical protein
MFLFTNIPPPPHPPPRRYIREDICKEDLYIGVKYGAVIFILIGIVLTLMLI